MTTRQFDPVFSAALRNELEALAEQQPAGARPARGLRRTSGLLHRPQLWVSVVTAIVLVVATVGVLRLTASPPQPAEHSKVVDPLSRVVDPSSTAYVARQVQVLLHVDAIGPGAHDFTVPAGVTSARVYLNCAPAGRSEVDIDGKGALRGTCSRESGSTYDLPVTSGAHELEVAVGARTEYQLLLMASPAPTVSPGALIDPLAAVRDRRTPDALLGDTRVIHRASGSRSAAPVAFPVPTGVGRLRAYLVCRPAAASSTLTIDGHVAEGCMNSVAHWFDFSPKERSVVAAVGDPTGGEWALLVVPAPKGAKDSPASTALPYPATTGSVLARARGAGAPAEGTYRRSGTSIALTVSCVGSGWVEISTADGGTTTRGTACSALDPSVGNFGAEGKDRSAQRWSVVPHGDVSWTFQMSDGD